MATAKRHAFLLRLVSLALTKVRLNSKAMLQDFAQAARVIQELYSPNALPKMRQEVKTESKKKICSVCFDSFTGEGHGARTLTGKCGHADVCGECFGEYLGSRIENEDVMPFIPCPTPGCNQPVSAEAITSSSLACSSLLRLSQSMLQRMLFGSGYWVPCSNSSHFYQGTACPYGFLVENEGGKSCTFACGLCQYEQEVIREKPTKEPSLAELIADGILRPCPKCDTYQMKDRGVCNVIQCPGCNIWWNWRTRITGPTSRALKAKARSDGSLWESGELEYQQELQRTDLASFRRLLRQNGVEFDPNYQRGT
eukprot:CAMPEP_0114488280 /NCGR_PEP_ID=MMETSP0109-20121206/1236_1 /TAXON_ID=29199 /ORGANISM="Chlorarachnion reptans, Strain CCCM449" /LENGTH=310 /DNA_ID=CAMNT_0001664643 /DNA_START=317 /DNA_END=1249 /DNA_ORIENTATION=+